MLKNKTIDMQTESRKEDHINICLYEDVRCKKNYWDDLTIIGENIPDFSLSDIDISCTVLGKKLKAPIIIAGMTGGCTNGGKINEMLAKVAEEFGIGLGLGSQRAGIEKEDLRSSYSVIKKYKIPLVIGNIGAPQFIITKDPKGLCESLIEMVNADCIAIHLNYAQEISQPEGEIPVKGFWNCVSSVSNKYNLMLKETGCGLSRKTVKKANLSGFKAVDTGGLGGTSFPKVEYIRSMKNNSDEKKHISTLLCDWGIPTPVSIMEAKPFLPTIATGGMRNGMDIAKALALGADAAGMALELLIAAENGMETLRNKIKITIDELKYIMFLTNSKTVADLQNCQWISSNELNDWLASFNHPICNI